MSTRRLLYVVRCVSFFRQRRAYVEGAHNYQRRAVNDRLSRAFVFGDDTDKWATLSTKNISVIRQLPEVHGDKFYYFGFGSNMLAKRIHVQNPSAVIVGPALLENYRVDFALLSEFWKGSVATIVPDTNSRTWGTLWEIDLVNLQSLDKQERVDIGWYRPVSVQVKLQKNSTNSNTIAVPARLYVITNEPQGNVHDMPPNEIPEDRKPSKTYLKVLVKGAIESGLPEYYVQWLKEFTHNNQTVKHLEELLELESVVL